MESTKLWNTSLEFRIESDKIVAEVEILIGVRVELAPRAEIDFLDTPDGQAGTPTIVSNSQR